MIVLALLVALASPPPFPTCAKDGAWCVAFSPFDDVTAALTGTIAGAKKSVTVAVFNISSPEITDALLERAHAGVAVTVLVDFVRPENAAIGRLAGDDKVRFIRVPSLRGGGPQMHDKLIVIDDEWLIAGTGNLTEPALVSSAEAFLATDDHDVVSAARADIDAMIERTIAACRLFATRSPRCPAGPVVWDAPFLTYARTGRFRPADVVRGPRCASFVAGNERLELWPVDRSRPDLFGCLKDPRLVELSRLVSTSAVPASFVDDILARIVATPAPSPARIRWLSSRSADVEEVFLQALARPRADPWAYVSLSRLHEKNIVEALASARARGARVAISVGSFLHTDAAGTDSGVLVLTKLAPLVVEDGFLTRGSLFHDKSVVVGDARSARLFFSSANWSAQAFGRSDESFFVVDDPALIALFLQNIVRGRALGQKAGGVDDDLRFLAAHGVPAPAPLVILRVTPPPGTSLAALRRGAVARVAARTVALRWDGTAPALWIGAVPPGDVVVEGGGAVATARLGGQESVSLVELRLPSTASQP